VGASVDLDEIQKTIDMRSSRPVPIGEGGAPIRPICTAAARLRDERSLSTNLGPLTASIAVKLYGSELSASSSESPSSGRPRDLRPFASLKIKEADRDQNLNEILGPSGRAIIEDLVPFLHDAYETKVDPEPTRSLHSVSETPVRDSPRPGDGRSRAPRERPTTRGHQR